MNAIVRAVMHAATLLELTLRTVYGEIGENAHLVWHCAIVVSPTLG